MKTRVVKIHSCDFCKKKLQRRPSMEKHELTCVHNPNRKCGFCEFWQQRSEELIHRRTLRTLIIVLRSHGLDRLKKESGNCPGCVLAAIVQSRKEQVQDPEYQYELIEGFIGKDQYDFGKAKRDFFAEFNRDENAYYA